MLSYAANHNRGAHFVDLKEHIDDQLVSILIISVIPSTIFSMAGTISCARISNRSKTGPSFPVSWSIMVAGAEPNHFYDTGYPLFRAYREILMHWKHLYRISSHNAWQVSSRGHLKRHAFPAGSSKIFKDDERSGSEDGMTN